METPQTTKPFDVHAFAEELNAELLELFAGDVERQDAEGGEPTGEPKENGNGC